MTFRPAVSSSILLTTILVIVILLGLGVILLVFHRRYRERNSRRMYLISGCLMFLMAAGSLFFRVRSYEIDSGNLLVKIGFGEKVLPLRGLQSAQVEENPFAGARRDGGVGGVWSYYGHFSSPRFGKFFAYATTEANGVLLVWPDQKVLVTPEDMAQFAQAARAKP
jgi:hypothetical protein